MTTAGYATALCGPWLSQIYEAYRVRCGSARTPAATSINTALKALQFGLTSLVRRAGEMKTGCTDLGYSPDP